MKVVIDASVAVPLLVYEEDFTDRAQLAVKRVSDEGGRLLAPELLQLEVGSALWKRVRREELTTTAARERLERLMAWPITFTASSTLSERSLALAIATGLTVYDSCYLSLALIEGAELLTFDQRLSSEAKKEGIKRI